MAQILICESHDAVRQMLERMVTRPCGRADDRPQLVLGDLGVEDAADQRLELVVYVVEVTA